MPAGGQCAKATSAGVSWLRLVVWAAMAASAGAKHITAGQPTCELCAMVTGTCVKGSRTGYRAARRVSAFADKYGILKNI